jgi:acetyl esterase/lipase
MKKTFPLALLILFLCVSCSVAGAPTSTPMTSSGAQQAKPSPTATVIPATEVPTTAEKKTTYLNLRYIPDGDNNQQLDVYLPSTGEEPFPTILMIHGGGFQSQSKTIYIPIAGYLNDLGYAVVSINYRLTPRFKYPAQVEDVFCALAWIHANHEMYGFDRENIFVWGGSAGGYLAAMIGTVDDPGPYLDTCPQELPESEWAKGIIVFYGFFDVTNIEGHNIFDVKSSLEPFMGAEYSEMPNEKLVEMSPISYVNGNEPPFLLIHGTADKSIESRLSEDFAALLEENGGVVELLLIPDAGHGFELKSLTGEEMSLSLSEIEAFLSRVLTPSN